MEDLTPADWNQITKSVSEAAANMRESRDERISNILALSDVRREVDLAQRDLRLATERLHKAEVAYIKFYLKLLEDG